MLIKSRISLSFLLLAMVSCGNIKENASSEAFQQAQSHYDSGFQLLESDSLMEAFPHFIEAANLMEILPEDMNDDEKIFVSRAYYQMSYVFRQKIESNAEIDALKRALFYQRLANDTTWILRSSLELANAYCDIMEFDSARYHLNIVTPYLDTVSGDLNAYFSAKHVLAFYLILRKRHINTLKDKDFEFLKIKVNAIYNDRFNNKFERILKEFNAAYPDALAKLKSAHPDLSDTELDVCVLSSFSFRLKETADILCLRENTVAKYRTAIKKKVGIDDLEKIFIP